MDVRNCKTCRRLFNYIGGPPLCQKCRDELEDKFQQVKEYINNNPRVPLAMIADDNEVTVTQLKQWVREERLVFTEDSVVAIECENCGATIRTGRYCQKCKDTMANRLTNAFKPPEPKIEPVRKPIRDGERMRFLDKDKK